MTRRKLQLAHLDFARPQQPLRSVSTLAGWGLLMAALLLAGWLAYDLRELDTRHQEMQSLKQTPRKESVLSPAVGAEIRFADETLQTGTTPWETLLDEIGAAKKADVTLTRLQVQGRAREIRISGEARHFDAVSAFLAALDARPGLAGSQLLGHQTEAPGNQVKFDALVRWKAP